MGGKSGRIRPWHKAERPYYPGAERSLRSIRTVETRTHELAPAPGETDVFLARLRAGGLHSPRTSEPRTPGPEDWHHERLSWDLSEAATLEDLRRALRQFPDRSPAYFDNRRALKLLAGNLRHSVDIIPSARLRGHARQIRDRRYRRDLPPERLFFPPGTPWRPDQPFAAMRPYETPPPGLHPDFVIRETRHGLPATVKTELVGHFRESILQEQDLRLDERSTREWMAEVDERLHQDPTNIELQNLRRLLHATYLLEREGLHTDAFDPYFYLIDHHYVDGEVIPVHHPRGATVLLYHNQDKPIEVTPEHRTRWLAHNIIAQYEAMVEGTWPFPDSRWAPHGRKDLYDRTHAALRMPDPDRGGLWFMTSHAQVDAEALNQHPHAIIAAVPEAMLLFPQSYRLGLDLAADPLSPREAILPGPIPSGMVVFQGEGQDLKIDDLAPRLHQRYYETDAPAPEIWRPEQGLEVMYPYYKTRLDGHEAGVRIEETRPVIAYQLKEEVIAAFETQVRRVAATLHPDAKEHMERRLDRAMEILREKSLTSDYFDAHLRLMAAHLDEQGHWLARFPRSQEVLLYHSQEHSVYLSPKDKFAWLFNNVLAHVDLSRGNPYARSRWVPRDRGDLYQPANERLRSGGGDHAGGIWFRPQNHALRPEDRQRFHIIARIPESMLFVLPVSGPDAGAFEAALTGPREMILPGPLPHYMILEQGTGHQLAQMARDYYGGDLDTLHEVLKAHVYGT